MKQNVGTATIETSIPYAKYLFPLVNPQISPAISANGQIAPERNNINSPNPEEEGGLVD